MQEYFLYPSGNGGAGSILQAMQQMATEQLVDSAVAIDTDGETLAGDNLVLVQMEITDRIKSSVNECKTAASRMHQHLKHKDHLKVKLTLDLLEICSKNGNLPFHRILAGKDFTDTFLLLVKNRRPKKGLFAQKILVNKEKRAQWEKVEEQVLSLIQLWADTFMMHEDKFPGFQQAYRLLRKEGVAFPARDPNERILMGSLGVDSPMFDYVEQISGKVVGGTPSGGESGTPAAGRTPGEAKQDRQRQELEREHKRLQDNDELARVEQIEFQDDEDDQSLARSKVDPQEYEIIRDTLVTEWVRFLKFGTCNILQPQNI